MRPEQSGRTVRVHTEDDAVVTAVVPRVVGPARRPPGRARVLLPWAGVGLLAVVVLTGTTVWSAGLRPAAAPVVPTLATDAAPTVAPSGPTAAPANSEPTSEAPAPRRPTPRVPVRETPPALPPVPTAAAPTVAATTTVPPTITPTQDRNPFGLGNEASCADPGAASRPECRDDSADLTDG